ncbi:putative UDP-glucuronosyl/UDP-glucosyltransferase, UDP-glycosyltransferase family [Helianthus annuus]|nr:putative UDP-glucuronosyl/UDP-glucosyltransferase, UDP-glycosyltransferase family [Helianthus annuus]
MASSPKDLHFVLFPLMQQGHMIPMIDIARILAHRNATVTIITTPVNATRFKPAIDRAIQAKLKIQVIELQLALAEVGLPEGCENFDMIPSVDLFVNMYASMDKLEKPSEEVLRRLTPAPSCIISDNQFPWTTDLAHRFGIPRLVFHGPGCFTYLCLHIVMNTNVLNEISSDSDYFVLPGIPDRIELTKAQAGGWGKIKEMEGMEDFFERMSMAEEGADGVVVNSFEELEPNYVKRLAEAKGKKVWCIGPVSLHNRSFLDMAERGKKAGIDGHDCLKWLDTKDPRSVIFVCLGSMSSLSNEQVLELGLGLELSSIPFIWCIRSTTDETDIWLSGYEERVKDRGLIVRGWAPQVLILSHEAVGGFVSHCGWNSTLEGVAAGVPMVTYPQFADQFLNERLVVDVLKTGVSIGMEVPVAIGEKDKFGALVKKENIKTAVESVMNNEGEGKARRERAREFGEMATKAMAEGGSSYVNTTLMMQDVIEELAKNTKPIQDVF